ncbi:cobyrinic acid a,c-diamide synthase [Burkholderia cenocepacia]|nr:cobyrinic acid a,c-diamide synthase [Burkholderia cenocepacia]
MVYLCESLTDVDGSTTPMLGLLRGHATMQRRFAALGMQQFDTRTGPMRGHTFHYSRLDTPLVPVATAARPDGSEGGGEAVYRVGAIVATYMHMYWPSNPDLVVALFGGEVFET